MIEKHCDKCNEPLRRRDDDGWDSFDHATYDHFSKFYLVKQKLEQFNVPVLDFTANRGERDFFRLVREMTEAFPAVNKSFFELNEDEANNYVFKGLRKRVRERIEKLKAEIPDDPDAKDFEM